MLVKRIKSILSKFDHILLLGSLVFLVASPIIEKLINSGLFWSEIATVIVVVSGLSVTYSNLSSRFRLKLYFGFFTIAISLIEVFVQIGDVFENIVQYSQVSFFLILNIVLFRLIIKARSVNSQVVINSISGYLIMGLSWSIVLSLWNNAFPGSFTFHNETSGFFDEVYFSFVTMTTLGYGDYLPVTSAAKSLSILISVTGAFYTTIVLGMIVGKYISNESIKQINKGTK